MNVVIKWPSFSDGGLFVYRTLVVRSSRRSERKANGGEEFFVVKRFR